MKIRWQDVTNVALGLWLFVSTAFLQHGMLDPSVWHGMQRAAGPEGVGSVAMWNIALAGLAVAFLSLACALAFRATLEWLNLALGIWLFASPWAFDFHQSSALRLNAVASGLVISALAAWALTAERGSVRGLSGRRT